LLAIARGEEDQFKTWYTARIHAGFSGCSPTPSIFLTAPLATAAGFSLPTMASLLETRRAVRCSSFRYTGDASHCRMHVHVPRRVEDHRERVAEEGEALLVCRSNG
jgi:hypothetical protein